MPKKDKATGQDRKADKATGPDWKSDKATGPDWKPDKDATQGNYGQAVSEAANTKPKPSAKPMPHADGQAHQGPKRNLRSTI